MKSSITSAQQQQQIIKFQRHIQNTNKQILKNIQHRHSAILKIDAVLGLENQLSTNNQQNQQTPQNQFDQFNQNTNSRCPNNGNSSQNARCNINNYSSQKPSLSAASQSLNPMLSLNDQQILYYSCRYFVIYNLSTKQYQIINKDIKNCKLMEIKKFDTTQIDKKLIVCVFQSQNKTMEKQHQDQSNCNNSKKYHNNQQNTISKQSSYGNGSSTYNPSLNSNFPNTFLALLTIKTDYQSRTSRNDQRYQWKVIKLFSQPIVIEHFTYFAKKNYVYFVVTCPSKPITANSMSLNTNTCSSHHQYLWVFNLNKQIMLINQQIKSNTVGYYIKKIFIEDNNLNIVYLIGKNYFRQWTINFNQRSIKQSNVRNVQRCLKNKVIVDVEEIQKYNMKQGNSHNGNQILTEISDTLNPHLAHNSSNNQTLLTQPSKLLLILTQTQLLIVKSNQLISIIKPQRNLSKQAKNKDNIQKQLQNSFNQIYKMKFLFDQYEQLKDKQSGYNKKKSNNQDTVILNKQAGFNFSCISKCWKSQSQNYYFAIGTNKFNVLIYEIIDFQIKLDTQYNYSKQIVTSTFKHILPTQGGDLLLIMSQNKQVHVINQQNYQLQDDLPIKSLWGNGQIHTGKIYSIASPVIQNIMCTVGQDGSFKLWSMKNNQRSIMFQQRPSSKPLGITIHPGGTMIGVNFQRQIKLFSILPKQFYQITSIKTNYTSLQLKYSHRGQFLVSNQGSVIIFYEPFSLKTLGYIEPAQLKCRIVDFKVTKNAQFICFTTEDFLTYVQPIDIGQLSKWQHLQPAHHQIQPYSAFYFDFYSSTSQNTVQKNASDERKSKSLFIGATKNKYMVLYDQLGSKLIAQFPVIDCHIVDIQVFQNILLAATNKGTIRVYNWPILQQDLQMQIINLEQKQIRYKPPRFEQYQIWNQNIPIRKIHKVNFSTNQIIVVNEIGNMGIISFQQTKNKKIVYEQVSGQRKKMEQLINQMFYIKKSEVQKRNKLIQKTENDILKVQNQIMRQKITLQRKMQQQQFSVQKGFQVKNAMQQSQKSQYIQKQVKDIQVLKKQLKIKKQKLQQVKKFVLSDYQSKKIYEKERNESVKGEIKDILVKHKQLLNKKISTHKQDIKNKKKQYFDKIKSTQKIFQTEIQQIYEKRIQQLKQQNKQSSLQQKQIKAQSDQFADFDKQNIEHSTKPKNLLISTRQSKLKRMSIANKKPLLSSNANNKYTKVIKSMEQQLNDQIIQQFTSKQNQQIILQSCRVQQLQKSNCDLQRQINNLRGKVQQMETEDQQLQKDFQKNLEEYNLSRFQNLNLHSEVLKMQNQLIQRKQVLDNKEEIVMLAYQQKQKLQNYKELVKGSLTKFQQKKENTRDVFFKKENDLNAIFSQLVNQIHKMENKKSQLQNLQGKIKLVEKQKQQKQQNLNQIIKRLKQVKKFLLLERMNQQKSQKSDYQFEQSLMNVINFLKKRLYMQSIKEKKNKQLKKSSLGQILKQNKNLLQQCNQLRSQGIQYENQIKNLSNKLKEANKMISIQTKLKSQKSQVIEQKNQLQLIRQLFKMHLNQQDQHNSHAQQQEQIIYKKGQTIGSEVGFQKSQNLSVTNKSQKNNYSMKSQNNKVIPNFASSFGQSLNSKDHNQYKPFKLSGYIQAEPFQKIHI